MNQIVLVGASTGAPGYHHVFLRRWPASLKAPVLIIQHMPPGPFLDGMFNYIARHVPCVEWAETGKTLQPGVVYLVQAEYHVRFNPDRSIIVEPDKKENYFCPSMDITFDSAAKIYRTGTAVIMCSGLHANHDGLNGCRAVRQQGGKVILATKASVECDIMIRHVKQAGEYDFESPLSSVLECAAQLQNKTPVRA